MSETANHKKPVVVATGFTTAFLGDERTLREFVIGDDLRQQLELRGENVSLLLINDSADALTSGQLRLAVNKDANHIRRFEHCLGRQISDVPDPYDCHASLSDHFAAALLQRLHGLDIHPVLIDSARAYRAGHYEPYISLLFQDYERIRAALSARFDHFNMRQLFRPVCPACRTIDATDLRQERSAEFTVSCERCGKQTLTSAAELKGKLSWKVDCAARWNIYGIHYETFSKDHVAALGTFEIARFISQEFFGGIVPFPVKYGAVRLAPDISGHLLEILPPSVLRQLFLSHVKRDLYVSREYVENFCQKTRVVGGKSYVEYVRTQLPLDALTVASGGPAAPSTMGEKSREELVHYGNQFSRFFYGQDHSLKLPQAEALALVDPGTATMAARIIRKALAIRRLGGQDQAGLKETIRTQLFSDSVSPLAYRLVRQLCGQERGPNVATLLALLPEDYLTTVGLILDARVRQKDVLDDELPDCGEIAA